MSYPVKYLGPKLKKAQKEVLLDLIKDYLGIDASIKTYDDKLYGKITIKKWQEFTEILNAQPNGVQRDWAGWKKTWVDIRLKMRKRCPANKAKNEETSAVFDKEFDENTIESLYYNDETDTAEQHLESIEVPNRSVTSNYQYQPTTIKIQPRKFPTKKFSFMGARRRRRQNHIFEHSTNKKKTSFKHTMKEYLNRKEKVKEDYYTKKLRLLERDVQAKEKMASSLRLLAEGRSDLF